MASSPTPSLESLPGANSIGSFGEPNDYLSDSPLTLSGSSPPISDSAICDDFGLTTSSIESHQSNNFCGSIGSGGSGGSIVNGGNGNLDLYPRCTGCKNKQSDAVAKCIDCNNFLCSHCVTAHQFMHCFDGHNVFRINDLQQNVLGLNNKNIMNSFDGNTNTQNNAVNSPHRLTSLINLKDDSLTKSIMNNLINNEQNQTNLINKTTIQSYFCSRHKNELLKFYCRTCVIPVCKDCMIMDHPNGLHDCEHTNDATPKQIENLLQIVSEVRGKASDMKAIIKNVEHNTSRIQVQYHKAQNEINDTYQFYRSMLDERKQELLKELESFHNAKNMSQSVLITKSQEHVDKVIQSCEFVERITKHAGLAETIMLKKLMENKLQSFLTYIQELQSQFELDFVSNYQAIQVGVRNTFGYIRSSGEQTSVKQPPIARPTSTNTNGIISTNLIMTNGSSPSSSSTGSLNAQSQLIVNGNSNLNNLTGTNGIIMNGCQNANNATSLDRTFSNTTSTNGHNQNNIQFESSNIISKRFNSANSLGPFVGDGGNTMQVNPYEKWSNGGNDNNIFNNLSEPYTALPVVSVPNETLLTDLTSKLMSSTIFPPKSQIKRQKMIYHCKFGEFGVMEGQFTEPSGVAVNAQNDIIVADTNNHRIQIFDKEGRFKFQFGECGKRDGQLLYPNRVAVVRTSGDIIVTERSPTHQIQIYNQYGQFVRKFGANILQHPRGVTVDNKGRIIVVECKVMRVIIFDQSGNVLQKFGCSKHLEFPNGVVVNDKQEIFISDNRAHCVKVFNYEGVYLRQIGGEGITNYPIGVGINAAGEILIADNHNNFNLTIFTQDGQLVSALESKVKHAQCFDVALMDDGSVVLASKDYRLYIYRYVQVPSIN
jgi:tripartite motif-containing protein 2/3